MKVPSLRVTNDDILDYLVTYSNGVSKQTLRGYQRLVSGMLSKTGSAVRYYRDKDRNEKASDFVLEAMRDALAKAEMSAEDIDVLIYCGVGKGFLEPANAYFYAAAMKMNCSCFDVADACMSWTRALEISHELLNSGRYKRIMIINGEFNLEHGLPNNLSEGWLLPVG